MHAAATARDGYLLHVWKYRYHAVVNRSLLRRHADPVLCEGVLVPAVTHCQSR